MVGGGKSVGERRGGVGIKTENYRLRSIFSRPCEDLAQDLASFKATRGSEVARCALAAH